MRGTMIWRLVSGAVFAACVVAGPIGNIAGAWAQRPDAGPWRVASANHGNAQAPSADCGGTIGPLTTASGRTVGPERCTILGEQAIQNARGVPYRLVEIALDGTLAGYLSLDGPRREMFTDVPEMALAQRDNHEPRHHGIARYEGATGTGMTVFVPADPGAWNGLLYVTAHGAGSYATVGDLVPSVPGRFTALTGANSYVPQMIDKGYAVAYTRRSSAIGPADDIQAVLDDGRTVGGLSLSYHTGLLRDFTALARNLVVERLGRAPERVYFYGHSAGASLGRLANYVPGANRDAAGNAVFQGFLFDDAGGGYYLPRLMVDGRDVLFTTPAERAAMAPQLEVAHQLYSGETGDFLQIKRENAWLLDQKGLGDRHRYYEVLGTSHFDAGRVSRMRGAAAQLASQNVDVGGVFDALIDALDAWVARGELPPTSRSDSHLLGAPTHRAVSLPDTACPTGVYYVFPPEVQPFRTATQLTAFAAFDGASQEPLDGRGYPVDMNRNNILDRRETIDEAWRRRLTEGETTGVLAPGERLTPEQYVRCVEQVAETLASERLLSRLAADTYIAQAREAAPRLLAAR